jgi:hypothetical protein
MARIILPNALPNLNYSITMISERILKSEEECAEIHNLDESFGIPYQKTSRKIMTYTLTNEMVQIKFDGYNYPIKVFRNGEKNIFYSMYDKNKIGLYLDDNIIECMNTYKNKTDSILSEYLGMNVNTILPINKMKKFLKCTLYDNVGNNFRSMYPSYGLRSSGRCIIQLHVHVIEYDNNTISAFLSFMIRKIELKPVLLANNNTTSEDEMFVSKSTCNE